MGAAMTRQASVSARRASWNDHALPVRVTEGSHEVVRCEPLRGANGISAWFGL